MIPDFFQSPEPARQFGVWGPVLGIIIVFLGTCVGVEIRVGEEEEDKKKD